MTTKIKWINENPGAPRDECGYWKSADGRFSISPNYRHTIYPDSYKLHDANDKTGAFGRSYDTVRDCKRRALWILEREAAQPGV